MDPIRSVKVTRYVSPLREGGSLPAIAEADDGFLYVVKFRGAGQGAKALIADFIGSEIARKLGLKVPELVFADLAEGFGRTEPDEEIQDLLKASRGLNLGVHFLSGATTFDPAVVEVDPLLASKIVVFDALFMNIDRTIKNTNLLWWHNELWLIDHGAGIYFHHNWPSLETSAQSAFAMIKDHVLLPLAAEIPVAKQCVIEQLKEPFFKELLDQIPEEWLSEVEPELSIETIKKGYVDFLMMRLKNIDSFTQKAQDARDAAI